jgi:hypothetical protein
MHILLYMLIITVIAHLGCLIYTIHYIVKKEEKELKCKV